MEVMSKLKGKRTYFVVAIGVLYVAGAWLGFWQLDEKVLGAIGFSGLGFLRAALQPSPLPAPSSPLPASEGTKIENKNLGETVKLLPLVFAVVFFGSGCAVQRVVQVGEGSGDQVHQLTKYTGIAVFNKSALEGMAVGKKTKSGSTLFSLEKANTETQSEAIAAAAEGLGTVLGAAVKAYMASQGLGLGAGSGGPGAGVPQQPQVQQLFLPAEVLQRLLKDAQTNSPVGNP